jgi:hypothetical protein
MNDASLKSLDHFMTFMTDRMGSTSSGLRDLEKQIKDVDEDINIARQNFNEVGIHYGGSQSRFVPLLQL